VTTLSSDMTLHCTVMLLKLKNFFISRAKFSYFLIFFFSVSGRLWVKGSAIRRAVKKFSEMWYSTEIVGHTTTLT
jgi:hypothetical protein